MPEGTANPWAREALPGLRLRGETVMTRQRWLKSSFSCELKPSRHLANRIVFCNDCLSNRTLWVSASGTLDCSACGSQNWMHLSVPLANRASLVANFPRVSLPFGARAAVSTECSEGEFAKGPHLSTPQEIIAAANYFAGWVDSRGGAAVQSIHQRLRHLRMPIRGILIRTQQVLWTRLCCIRSWLAPAKQA